MACVVGAVDIGGTKVEVGLVAEGGRLLARRSAPTASMKNPEQAVDFITATLAEWQAERRTPIAGIGIGCTGPVDAGAGVVGDVAFLPAWQGFPLAAALAAQNGVPTLLDNDALAGALAEWRWGAGQGSRRFVYVSVGTGIGIGVIIDGAPYRGAGGVHPEYGHHSIDASGPPCYCGASGCWESSASGPAMEAWYAAETGKAIVIPARDIFARAGMGEAAAMRAVEREGRYLGIGLANVAAAFAPDRIALGGGLMAAWGELSRHALDIARHRGLNDFAAIGVRRVMLGDEAPLLGAAQIWLAQGMIQEEKITC